MNVISNDILFLLLPKNIHLHFTSNFTPAFILNSKYSAYKPLHTYSITMLDHKNVLNILTWLFNSLKIIF